MCGIYLNIIMNLSNWSEKLGVDDEVWEYTYSDTNAVIPHIFKTDSFITRMRIRTSQKRTHPIDEKQFWNFLEVHRQDMIRESCREVRDVYKEAPSKSI